MGSVNLKQHTYQKTQNKIIKQDQTINKKYS